MCYCCVPKNKKTTKKKVVSRFVPERVERPADITLFLPSYKRGVR